MRLSVLSQNSCWRRMWKTNQNNSLPGYLLKRNWTSNASLKVTAQWCQALQKTFYLRLFWKRADKWSSYQTQWVKGRCIDKNIGQVLQKYLPALAHCSVFQWFHGLGTPDLETASLKFVTDFFSLSLPSYVNFKLNYAFYEETTLCIEAALLCFSWMSPHLGTTKHGFILNFSISLMIMGSPILLSSIPFLCL